MSMAPARGATSSPMVRDFLNPVIMMLYLLINALGFTDGYSVTLLSREFWWKHLCSSFQLVMRRSDQRKNEMRRLLTPPTTIHRWISI